MMETETTRVPTGTAPNAPTKPTSILRRPRLPFSPWHLLLMPMSLIILAPLFWMILTSLKTSGEAAQFPPTLVPRHWRWHNYIDAWRAASFGRYFINSSIVAVGVVVSNLLLCSLAGYAFARLRFLGRGVLFGAIMATLMIPFQVTMIPVFLVVKWLGDHVSPFIGINTLGGVMMPNLATAMGIFLLRQFFSTVPVELEEAARIDGTSRLGIIFKILLPLSTPVLATLAVLTFLKSWNDFLWPLVVINSSTKMTLPLGLTTFQGSHVTDWSLLMAGNVITLVPMAGVFIAAQRFFIRSVANTGLKG
jgi:multiple sugar transport system permease protein